MFSANKTIPHQLRPASNLHDVHVISCSRCHPSFIHIPSMREDRSRKRAHCLPNTNSLTDTNYSALPGSENPHSPPTQSTSTSSRQYAQHQGHSPPLNRPLAPTVSHLFPPQSLPETARCILPAARLRSQRDRAAYCAGRSRESANLFTCRQYGGGNRWAGGRCGDVGEGVGAALCGRCG